MAVPGIRLVVADQVIDRERRRAQQEAYRRELNSQVADSEERRKLDAQRIRELEARHELKSATYNPWGKQGSGAPLRQANGELVTNVKAYHRAKLQGLIAQDLSPNEIGDDEQPFGFTLATKDDPQYGSPPRTSRSLADATDGRRSVGSGVVSLSPPRSRYRFDRLPPEEQNYVNRRRKERQELEAALLAQMEEKRLKKEREIAAKREEDGVERMRVIRALAEERAANPSRIRDKNLREGEAPALLYPSNTGDGHSRQSQRQQQHQNICGAVTPRRRSVVWQQQRQQQGETVAALQQRERHGRTEGEFQYRNDRVVENRCTTDACWGETGRRRSTGGATWEPGLRGDGDRDMILLILRRLEDHGRMLDQLASELAGVKSAGQPAQGQVVTTDPAVASRAKKSGACPAPPTRSSDTTFQPYGVVANSSSLSPLLRTFQNDEDQLDRLLLRFARQDSFSSGAVDVLRDSTLLEYRQKCDVSRASRP